MPKRLRARVGLSYPAPGSSLATVKRAGGLSKLTPAEREKVMIRRIAPGEWCDDLPRESRAWMLEQGIVEEIEAEE